MADPAPKADPTVKQEDGAAEAGPSQGAAAE
jgi:hypothetical protein